MESLLKLTGALLLLVIPVVVSSTPLWTDITTTRARSAVATGAVADSPYKAYRHVATDTARLRSVLNAAPMENSGEMPAAITLPMPDGSLREFVMQESPVMEPGLAQHIPEFKSYKVRAVDDATVTGRISIDARGFNGMIMTHEGAVFIDPVPKQQTERYYSFYKHDYDSPLAGTFTCKVQKQDAVPESPVSEFRTLARTTGEKIQYTIAVATTGEYSQAVATSADVQGDSLAAVSAAINRINQIYERDLGIRLVLSANNANIIYTDPDNDPYMSPDVNEILDENQAAIDSDLMASYDLGHVFSTAGGGLAGFGVACDPARKAKAGTGFNGNLTGDPFYIDLVAHEIGHQFAADHTFNGTTSACGGGNRWAPTSFEPGSGSTIMAYAGICGSENVQANSDATFHAGSIEQIINFTRSGDGSSCSSGSGLNAGNNAPVASAGPDYVIPRYTAFTLTGSATDSDGDTLSYQWDQMDAGTATSDATYGDDLCDNALFRSFSPSSSPVRNLPQMSTLKNNTTDKAETIPSTSRFLNFRLTVRDGNGGVHEDDMRISVVNNSDVFKVLQPNSAIVLGNMANHVIEWNSACTEQAPISCSNVDILLSLDGGGTFTPVVTNTPNDGSETVILSGTSSDARIKVACSDNIFFDISDVSFTLASAGVALSATGNGGSIGCTPGSLPVSCSVAAPPLPSGGGGGGGGLVNLWFLLGMLTTIYLRIALTRRVIIPAQRNAQR